MTQETKKDSKPKKHSHVSTPMSRFCKVLARGNQRHQRHYCSPSDRRLGVFCLQNASSVIVNGKITFVGPGGIRVLQILSRLYKYREQKFSLAVLRRTAKKLRTIDVNNEGHKGVRTLLNLLIEHTTLDDRRRLFIWLRGRLGGRSGTDVIALFSDHPNWRTRKEVARSLKRLHGWPELRHLYEKELHPTVRRMAEQVPVHCFEQRLGKFCQSVEPRESSPPPSKSLFVDESVSFLATMPKPLQLIRRLLKRISIGVSNAR